MCASPSSITHVDELLLLLVRHLSEAVVLPLQVVLQAGEGVHHHPLHLPALRPGAGSTLGCCGPFSPWTTARNAGRSWPSGSEREAGGATFLKIFSTSLR